MQVVIPDFDQIHLSYKGYYRQITLNEAVNRFWLKKTNAFFNTTYNQG